MEVPAGLVSLTQIVAEMMAVSESRKLQSRRFLDEATPRGT